MASCYGAAATVQVEKPEEDPFEAAFEKCFSAVPEKTPANPESHDPLGLDDAFDEAFPTMPASDADETSQSDSSAKDVDSDSDESEESRPGLAPSPSGSANISDMESDDAANADGVEKNIRRRVHKMRQNASFKRDGKKVIWGWGLLGNITSWSGNVSCNCRLHSNCRAPASKVWGSDVILENWLLAGICENGDVAVDRELHQRLIAAASARVRLHRS